MSVITVADVKTHLLGYTPYITAAAAKEGFAEASFYGDNIRATEADFQRDTRILLSPKTIRCNPDGSEEYDIEEEPMDLHRAFSRRSIRFHLRHRPIIEILSMRYEFNDEYRVLTFPANWQRVHKRLGVVSIVPYGTAGIGAASAGGLMFLPHLGYWAYPGGVIPRFVAVDYTAGYDNPEDDDDYADLCNGLASAAALRVLRRARGLIPNSTNLDGFSQNFDSMQERLKDLEEAYATFMKKYKHRERPLVAGIL